MLPIILSRIEKWIRDNGLVEESKISSLMKLMKYFNREDWIYPGVLMRKLRITSQEAYKLLEFLKDKGILETNYEIYCHSCNRFKSKIYSTFSEIPETAFCYDCDTELIGIDNIIVIYKVINDGSC